MAPSLIFGTKDLLKHGALQKSGVNNTNYEEELDFIEYLLIVDHTKRPTALEALQHPYLDALP